jgi:acetyl-CoA synthetase
MSAQPDRIAVAGYEAPHDGAAWEDMYRRSIEAPEAFWREQARSLDWKVPFTKVRNVEIGADTVSIRWFEDGVLNASVNCLDRHLADRGEQVAILWEGDEPDLCEKITFRELHAAVCRLANGLRSLGIGKGDRVAVYLPMIPEAAIAMLACARIGAIHSVVFAGFSADALAGRIQDCGARLVITANEGLRGGRRIPLKRSVDEALKSCPGVERCIVVGRTGADVGWQEGRDIRYVELVEAMSPECEPEWMGAEDPLFILYTSGSTGRPKGVLHTTGGYLLSCALSHRHVFDLREGDVYWCTADVGWVTGHSYIVYGPLANGTTTLMFEGVPTYPSPSRLWEVCDRHGVTIFYTAPTAIRALMREGDAYVTRTDRSSLRVLGSVGEPINPEAWRWYFQVVGDGRCPVVDTWWQTETGTIMIAPIPGMTPLKPGSATRPFLGVVPVLVDERGQAIEGPGEGLLCLKEAGPGIMRTIHGDPQRFFDTYFRRFPGLYFTGDGCRRDEDGYYWITGRRRRDQCLRAPPRHRGDRKRAGGAYRRRGSRGGWLSSRDEGTGHPCLRHGEGRDRGNRAAAAGAAHVRPPPDRADRPARRHPMGGGVTEDAVRQDHAAHPAPACRRPHRRIGRRVHARRSGRGRGAGPVGRRRKTPAMRRRG